MELRSRFFKIKKSSCSRPVGLRKAARPRVDTRSLWNMVYPAGVRRIHWCAWFGVRAWPARLLIDLASQQLMQLERTGKVAEARSLIETCGRKCLHLCHSSDVEDEAERAVLEAARSEVLRLIQRARAEERWGKRRRRRPRGASDGGGEGVGSIGGGATPSRPPAAREGPCSP